MPRVKNCVVAVEDVPSFPEETAVGIHDGGREARRLPLLLFPVV